MKEPNKQTTYKPSLKTALQPTSPLKTKLANKPEKIIDEKSIQGNLRQQQKPLKDISKEKLLIQEEKARSETQKKYLQRLEFEAKQDEQMQDYSDIFPQCINSDPQNQLQQKDLPKNTKKTKQSKRQLHQQAKDINISQRLRILQDYACKNIYQQSQQLRKLGTNISAIRAQQFYQEALKQYKIFARLFQQREELQKTEANLTKSIQQLQKNRKLMEYVEKSEIRARKYKSSYQNEQIPQNSYKNNNALSKKYAQLQRNKTQFAVINGMFKCQVKSCGKIMRSYEAYLVHQKKHFTQQKQSNNSIQKASQHQGQKNLERPKSYAQISQKNHDSGLNQNKKQGKGEVSPDKKDSAEKPGNAKVGGQGRGHRQRRPQHMDDAFIYQS